jgi:hypothetical protein
MIDFIFILTLAGQQFLSIHNEFYEVIWKLEINKFIIKAWNGHTFIKDGQFVTHVVNAKKNNNTR